MNYYDILGINKNASDDEIKKAFRKKARECHPDRGGDPEKFKEVNEAYEVLSDPDKKNHYDRYGSIDNYGQPTMDDIFDPFADFFGRGRKKQIQNGQTIQMQIGLTVKEVFEGCTKKFKVKRKLRCNTCNGTGGDYHECPHCKGTGIIMEMQQFGPGSYMQTSKPCPYCNGTGKEFSKKCKDCNGTGFKEITEEISVTFPKGVRNIEHKIFNGKGYESKDKLGKNGDLIIIPVYNFGEDFEFGNNVLYQHIKVPYYDCILGCTKTITLGDDSEETIIIPKGSINGNIIALKHKGINGGTYYVVIHIEYPEPKKEEIELLKNIQKLYK